MELISQREYAIRRGCSEGAVRKAIKAGKIVNGVVRDEKGKPQINPAVADVEWSQNFNPNYAHNNPTLADKLAVVPETPLPPIAPPVDEGDQQRTSIAKVKHTEATLKAKLLHMKVQEQSGLTVKKADIAPALFDMGVEVRKAIMELPARHIDKLRSIADRNEAQIYWEEISAGVLERITQVISREL